MDILRKNKLIIRNIINTAKYIRANKSRYKIRYDNIKTILFVCQGNKYRSVFSEYYANKIIKEKGIRINILSCGILANEGNAPPENSIKAADYFQVDIRNHKSRILTETLMEYASVIITMHYHNIKEIFEKQPIIIKKTYLLKHLAWPRYFLLDINDPYGKPLNEVIECYKEIKECIDIFIDRTIRISETLRSPL